MRDDVTTIKPDDKEFLRWSRTTVIYTFWTTIFAFLFGMMLAVVLNQIDHYQNLFRILILIPWAIPPVVSGFIYNWFFNDAYGAANDLFLKLGLIDQSVKWLTRDEWAIKILIACDTWTRIPFVTIMLLAGLQTIPAELYEAARIDGANLLQLFWKITIPYLKAPIMVAMMTVSVFVFRTIAIMLILTDGQPGDSTELMGSYVYKKAFYGYMFGRASTASIIMMLCGIGIILFWVSTMRSEVHE